MFDYLGALPKHQYVLVDTEFTHVASSECPVFVPAVWFGLVSYPGRTWGLNVMLESGAVYRNLPPHAVSFTPSTPIWSVEESQTWDCYGTQFAVIEYPYLAGLDCKVRIRKTDHEGQYLFTAAPFGDGFSAYPEQSKEFSFIRLGNGRLTIQPTNNILFVEKSFTRNPNLEFPKDLRRQKETWSCE